MITDKNSGSHYFGTTRFSYVIVCTQRFEDGTPTIEVIDKKFNSRIIAEQWSEDHRYSDCEHSIAELVMPE